MRPEAAVFAHIVIHSVTCTPRGPSLVSPLLPFKEGTRAENIHTCMRKLASALVGMLLFEQRISPPVLLVPPAEPLMTSHNRHVLGPGTDMKCEQVLATGKRLFNSAFYCATHPVSSSVECVRAVIAVSTL